MPDENTTAVVQRYLDELAGERPPSPSSGPCWTGPSVGCTSSAPRSCTAATRG